MTSKPDSQSLPAKRARGLSWARIDPEGNVSATWNTWAIIAGAICWLTLTYAKLDGAADRVEVLAAEVQKHREALIKAGLLSIGPKAVPPSSSGIIVTVTARP